MIVFRMYGDISLLRCTQLVGDAWRVRASVFECRFHVAEIEGGQKLHRRRVRPERVRVQRPTLRDNAYARPRPSGSTHAFSAAPTCRTKVFPSWVEPASPLHAEPSGPLYAEPSRPLYADRARPPRALPVCPRRPEPAHHRFLGLLLLLHPSICKRRQRCGRP